MRTLIAFLALSTAAAAQSTITVTGKVFYEDRTYTGSGFTGLLENRPVRQAEIDLMNSAGDTILASGLTDEDGAYSLSFFGFHQDARVQVYSQRMDGTGKMRIAVLNHRPADLVYAVLGEVFNTMTDPAFADLVITRVGVGGAFNIFDCAVKSFQYLGSIEPTLADPAPVLTIYWEDGTTNGTYFDSGVPAIFLLGRHADPDEYDDDIILHEIGHWVAVNFSKDDTIGGPHGITDQLDPRLSWSEGWAHYWSAVVRVYVNANISAEYVSPNLQVDNYVDAGKPKNGVFDLEGPSFATFCITAKNEVAVAAILWDLADPDNELFDVVPGLESDVWKSFHGQIPGRSDITLEDFHEGLAAVGVFMPDVSGSPGSLRIFNAREVRYYADPSEPNSVATTAPVVSGLLTLRTFYGTSDSDWYTVVAPSGNLVVETLNLKDGADTKLELYDSTGVTLLASSDNRGSGDKSSRIMHSVKAATTFRVRVLEVDQIVQFGTYDLQVQTTKGGGGGGDGCGLTGAEGLLLLAFLRRIRRR